MVPLHVIKASLDEVLIIDIAQLDPLIFAPHKSKDAVLVVTIGPVEDPILGCARDTSGSDLFDVDVGFLVVFVDVLVDREGDGSHGDGFTEEP